MTMQFHKMGKWSIDKTIMLISILYIVLPIIIFCFGWLKVFLAIPISLIFIYFIYKSFMSITGEEVCVIKHENIWFWIGAVSIAAIWVYLAGIGGMASQNSDYWARNAIYRDLCNYSWPVIYDLGKEPEYVQAITGSTGEVAFSYYFSWWLLPALVSKVFGLGEVGRSIALYIFAVVGILCVIYGIVRYFRKTSYVILSVLVFFSGLDVVGFWIKNAKIPEMTTHFEWWSGYFQLSSNTTLLFWVFNQTIPVWIIVILMMQINNANSIGLASLSFAYSPWAVMGIVPIAAGKCIKKDKNEAWRIFKEFFSVSNILISLVMLIIYGMFYTCGVGDKGLTGFIFTLNSPATRVLINLIAFLFFEIIIFYLIMGKSIFKKDYYVIVLLEFLIMPLFTVIQYSWLIRGLIPASFILMMYCIAFLLERYENKELKIRKTILIIVLIVGAFTPVSEIVRITSSTMNEGAIRYESVYSFGDIRTEDVGMITTTRNQFFKYEYADSAFFKYLAK